MPLSGGTTSGASGSAGTTTSPVTPVRVVANDAAPLTMLKTSPGTLVSVSLSNNAPSARFARFYDTATMPDPTTAPVWVGPFMLPASDTFTPNMPEGLTFTKGLAIMLSSGSGDTDTSAILDGDVIGFVGIR